MRVMRTPLTLPEMPHPAARAAPASRNDTASAGRDARLSGEEYAAWLLPPRPRDGVEKLAHALSLAAGAVALTGGFGALWWIL